MRQFSQQRFDRNEQQTPSNGGSDALQSLDACEGPRSAAPKTRFTFLLLPLFAALATATAWMLLHGTRM